MSARHYCDLLIIGSGITGLSAAISACDAGLDVIIISKEADLQGIEHVPCPGRHRVPG